jgi:antitoxin (DNA-binding transcriptional repressor) of toxin-antitoxin stability system
MTRIRVGALKDRLSETLRAVEKGASVIVTDRDRPIAYLSPVPEEEGVTLLPATRPFAPIRDRKITKVRGRVDSLALLRAERGAR